MIVVSDEEIEVVEQKPPKKKRLKVSDNKQEEQNCSEISEQMIDYYLVLCLKKWHSIRTQTFDSFEWLNHCESEERVEL